MADSEQKKDIYGSLGGEPATMKEWTNCAAEQLEKAVRQRPMVSLALALAAGFLLASLRRR